MTQPPLLDKTAILKRLGNSEPLLKKVIEQFLGFYTGELAGMEAALGQGDANTVHRAVHRIRGSACYFDYNDLMQTLQDLEASAKVGDLESIRPLFGTLREHLEVFAAALRAL